MIGRIFLWLFVIVLGLEMGAGLYETFVVLPLWVYPPPDSVIAYYHHNAADPQFTLHAGTHFWIFNTPLVGLLSIATLLTGFRTRPEHRCWRMAGSILALIVVIFTFAWFVPNIMRLNGDRVLQMSPADIASTTTWWVRLNWVRAVVYFAGWLAALRAFSIPAD